jgi:hypothetical protein
MLTNREYIEAIENSNRQNVRFKVETIEENKYQKVVNYIFDEDVILQKIVRTDRFAGGDFQIIAEPFDYEIILITPNGREVVKRRNFTWV